MGERKMKVLVINGVNLNMLGMRGAEYGSKTLAQINEEVKAHAETLGVQTEFFQSNIEGEIVNAIQQTQADGIVINAGAYTHYSYAIAEALRDKRCFKIEVHMTNVFAREEFRHKSVLSEVCDGVIVGFKEDVYRLAVTETYLHANR